LEANGSRGGEEQMLSDRKDGGASRDRTDDLIVANDALSQLSYSPTRKKRVIRILTALHASDQHSLVNSFLAFLPEKTIVPMPAAFGSRRYRHSRQPCLGHLRRHRMLHI